MSIRKLSVGSDPFKQMHYVVGQNVMDQTFSVSEILKSKEGYDIWILKNEAVVRWKTISKTMPVSVEHSIDI
jgi:hypothetical protein